MRVCLFFPTKFARRPTLKKDHSYGSTKIGTLCKNFRWQKKSKPVVAVCFSLRIHRIYLSLLKMSESEVARIPRPKQLRGLLNSQIKRSLAVVTVIAFTVGASYKFLIAEPRKRRYAEFYKDYDAEKEFNRMRNKGLFQSCDPDE